MSGSLRTLTFHVQMLVSHARGFRESNAVNNGCMVELIGDDGVLLAKKSFENACVGIKAAGIEYGILATMKLSNFCLELFVNVLNRDAVCTHCHQVLFGQGACLSTANESHRRQA